MRRTSSILDQSGTNPKQCLSLPKLNLPAWVRSANDNCHLSSATYLVCRGIPITDKQLPRRVMESLLRLMDSDCCGRQNVSASLPLPSLSVSVHRCYFARLRDGTDLRIRQLARLASIRCCHAAKSRTANCFDHSAMHTQLNARSFGEKGTKLSSRKFGQSLPHPLSAVGCSQASLFAAVAVATSFRSLPTPLRCGTFVPLK